jgi:hypothetical protein
VLLQPFGIKSHTIKAEALKGYRFSDFKDAWERYVPPMTSPETMPDDPAIRDETPSNVSQSVSVTSSVTDNSINTKELVAR